VRKLLAFILIGVLGLSNGNSRASAAEKKPVSYFKDVEVLFLQDHTFGVFEVARRYAGDFQPISGKGIRFWNPEESLWIRIPMSKLREAQEAFFGESTVLILWNEYVSVVDFFLPVAPGEFKHWVHGLDTPVERRSFPSRYPSFRLEDGYDEGYAYLNVSSAIPVAFGLAVQEEQGFQGMFVDYLTQYMAFFSFLAALALTYLFFYFMTGDWGYFIVVLRQLMTFVFLFAFHGYLQYYFHLSPRIVDAIYWPALGLHCVMTSFFGKYLLQLDIVPKWLRKLIFVQTLTAASMIIFALSGLRQLTGIAVVLSALMEVASITFMGIIKLRQGYRLILFCVLSRISFLLGLVFLLLNVLFVWSTHAFEYLSMFSFLLDPIFLALMMIPGTRSRFENYFSIEQQSLCYESLGQRDGMTGLYNKAYFLALLDENLQAALLAKKQLAFIMMDVDYFQKFNDLWGYPEGDKALFSLAKLIRQCLRESDIAARYGGGEFAIILPGGTLPSSVLMAERIRQTFEKQTYMLGKDKAVTLSLGLAFLRAGDTVAMLIQRAGEALDRAKVNGRNRTEFEVAP
jgi:diguanylate cyclase (GGDEF)-like protein